MQAMADVPAGAIALRDDRVGTRWQVSLPAFRLSRFPVWGPGDVPLTGLSWYDAVALCNQLSPPSRRSRRPERSHPTFAIEGLGLRLAQSV